MQRWWFLDDKSGSLTSGVTQKPKKTNVPIGNGFQHKFRVLVTQNLLRDEIVAITGNCDSLGNWDPQHVVQMKLDDEKSNIWSAELELPNNDISYKYLICSVDPLSEDIHVRRFETHLNPRTLSANRGGENEVIDTLGDIDGSIKLDKGWITTETIIQFKFFENPFSLKERMKKRLLYVKITPMNMRIHAETSDNITDESLSNDTGLNSTENQAYAFTEVVTLTNPNSTYEQQSQFGSPYFPNDFVVFNIIVNEPENMAYLIDLYTYSSRSKNDELPYHLGYHYILPNFLKKSEGVLEMPVTCSTKHRPLGMMKIEYLKIKPLLPPICDLEKSYVRYWNSKWTGLEIGHRGNGTSFKASDGNVIRENTIASLKKAVAHGADMVEFDVQLSKDLVPVIYHDFDIYVSLKRKTTQDINDMLELPMRELTLEQLRNLKVYHVAEGRSRSQKFFDEDLDDHQPFPKLADALDSIDPNAGFNIEVKWSQKLKDGTMEADLQFDPNLYVDCILRVVFEKAGNRKIVFSCFDADICTMLRYKQNRYPVMFLTLGVTSKYPSYYDPRCNSIEMAVRNACTTELLGIVAHTEDLLRDQMQVNLATERGLIIFCWGDDNNCKETIKRLKNIGIHAIIYDKMDELSEKGVKESVYLVQASESQRNLLQQIDIENRFENNASHDFIGIINDEELMEMSNKHVLSSTT